MKCLIATPALNCSVTTNYASSLVSLIEYCQKSFIGFDTLFLGHTSIIQKARNDILNYALKGNYTHLLMIDSDMGWEWEALELLKNADRPVISALCPKKKYPLEYAFSPKGGAETDNRGVLEVTQASTAFMLIKLDCFTEEHLAKIPNYLTVSAITGKQEITRNFFRQGPAQDGWFLGEDVGFSRLLVELKIPQFIHTKVKTSHAGTHIYREDNEQTYLKRHQSL